MPLQLLTLNDLESFKHELLGEIRNLFGQQEVRSPELLKSKDVCKLLRISAGTLQHLRKTRQISFTKMGGTIYYSREEVRKLVGVN